MQQEYDSGPLLGMCACDAELFHRVWERVETGDPARCPVSANPPGMEDPDAAVPVVSAAGARHIASAPGAEQADSGSVPEADPGPDPQSDRPTGGDTGEEAAPAEPAAPQEEGVSPESGESGDTSGGDDFPPEDDLPCLGSGSAGQGSQLQTYIREELEGWQLYRLLARRVNGPRARTLTALASEKHRCARRLAAAYFLISGVRYWPTDRLETPVLNAWLGVLRSRFSLEQRREFRYRAAMCDTCDPCLRELYGELAADCARHAAAVRALLESAL